MFPEPIIFFNRYSHRLEEEAVYGEKYLVWAYHNPIGRLCLHLLVKRALFSRWYGWRMKRPLSRTMIRPFIDRYKLDPAEFVQAPEEFASFNEFFCRKLRPEARPIQAGDGVAVFPADGRHFACPDLARAEGFLVKGERFDLGELLADPGLMDRFGEGTLIGSRLCPVDYHRFHFPVAGRASRPRFLPGPLFSVNPMALRRNIHILARNKRVITPIQSEEFGEVLMVEIGATNVGSIRQTFAPDVPMARGAEKGFFEFGGSYIITLFQKNRVRLAEDLVEQSSHGRELYARVGDYLGRA